MSTSRHLAVLVMAACVFLWTFGIVRGVSQELLDATSPSARATASTPSKKTASGALLADSVETYIGPEFLGAYRADGRFKAASKLSSYFDAGFDDATRRPRTRPAEVPRWIDLGNRNQSVIEDFAPPAHARKSLRLKPALAGVVESIVAFVYGREPALRAPTHVAVDSRQRLIVSDPGAAAVHVLTGQDSFRIVGGPGRRLLRPNGIAIDGDDNIYVADGRRGMVLVYDPQGRFLRFLGAFKGESMFQEPTGIAIDREAGRLYVLDSPAGELIVMDLQGNVIKRAGGSRKISDVSFEYPSEIAVRDSTVVVLDRYGARVQVLDLLCNPVREFKTRNFRGPTRFIEMGVALDSTGRIYLSNVGPPPLLIYSQTGKLIGSLGRVGGRNYQFDGPSGLWVGPTDRMYIADTNNNRVQVFQLPSRASASKQNLVPDPQKVNHNRPQPGSSGLSQ